MSGETIAQGVKSSSTLLGERRGFRLSVALCGAVLCWACTLNWAHGRVFPWAYSLSARLLDLAPLMVGSGLSLVCLGWASSVLMEGMARNRRGTQANAVAAEEWGKPWSAAVEVKAIAAVFIVGTLLNWAIGLISGGVDRASARGLFLASGAAVWLLLIGMFFKVLRSHSPEGRWRKFAPVLLAPPLVAMVFGAILTDPAEAGQPSPLYWGLRAALACTLLLIPASIVPGLLPVWLVRHGRFNLALKLNRAFFWSLGNNPSTEGWIVVMAGRYAEARAYLKPLAFDAKGHPRLNSQEFYLYSLALSIEGDYAAAEVLFEAAVNVPQDLGNFHFGLAENLLVQKKDSKRARQLVESVLTGYPANPRTSTGRANRVQLIAFYAWALAADGWKEGAEEKLQEAIAGSTGMDDCGRAGTQLPVGHAWLALGDPAKARQAFEQAVQLFPHGDIAMRARKELALLAAY
jgi:hypothetical protein